MFRSVRTVDHHLAAAFAKLDVTSRTEAVAAALQCRTSAAQKIGRRAHGNLGKLTVGTSQCASYGWNCGSIGADLHQGITICPATSSNELFPEGLRIPVDASKAPKPAYSVIANNGRNDVTWLHSYVSQDLRTTFCVYDGPTPDAIREAARANNLPVGNITDVNVLEPYFYRG